MYVSVGGMAQAIDIYTQLKERSLEWIEKFGQGEDVRGERTRLLSRACVYAVKLAELCTSEYAPDPERCHEELVWAVTTTMKERRRREVEGVKEGEGPWQSDDEVGSQMEGASCVSSLASCVLRLASCILHLAFFPPFPSPFPPLSFHKNTHTQHTATEN